MRGKMLRIKNLQKKALHFLFNSYLPTYENLLDTLRAETFARKKNSQNLKNKLSRTTNFC